MAKSYKNLYLRGGIWTYDSRHNGKRYKASCNTSNVREAEKVLRDVKAALEYGNQPPPSLRHTPGAAPKKFAETRLYADKIIEQARARGSSETTLRDGLVHCWERLCREFSTVDSITNDSVAAYFYRRIRDGLRWASVKRDIPSLRDCVNKWGRKFHPELELVDWEVPHKPRHEELGVNQGSHKEPAFLREWAASLKGRAQAQALVAMCTGMRATEVRRVQPEWVQRIEENRIRYILRLPATATKEGSKRSIGLPATIAAIIKQHFPITEDYKKTFNLTAKRLGHDDTVTLRDIRHTFKVHISRKETLAVQLVMGHRRVESGSGDFYQHLLDEDCIRVAPVARELFLSPEPDASEDQSRHQSHQ